MLSTTGKYEIINKASQAAVEDAGNESMTITEIE